MTRLLRPHARVRGLWLLVPGFALAAALLTQSSGSAQVAGQPNTITAVAERIRTEGLRRSRALDLYHTLTDDIGGRLTGSPAHLRAARWASERFTEWGLANPRLEPFEF